MRRPTERIKYHWRKYREGRFARRRIRRERWEDFCDIFNDYFAPDEGYWVPVFVLVGTVKVMSFPPHRANGHLMCLRRPDRTVVWRHETAEEFMARIAAKYRV